MMQDSQKPAARQRPAGRPDGRAAWPLAVGLAATLAGCSLQPFFAQPAAPVAADYPADAPRPDATPAPASDVAGSANPVHADGIFWNDYFVDPQLRGLIRAALDNSRDLKMAVLRVEEARALYGIQRADQFPTLGIGADGTRGRTPADLSMSGKAGITSQYQVGAQTSAWELDFWGRVRSLKDAALEQFLASDAARRAATVGLVTQVADAYLTLCELDERLELTRRTIATRRESFRIFTRRFEVGSTSRLDLAQVETLLTQAEALGAQLEQARASAAHALSLLVGAPVELASRPDALHDDAIQRELPVGLPADLLIQRPDIVAAEHRLKAAQANIGAARAAFFPRITLTGFAGTASAELDGLFDGGSGMWRFMPSLSLPIFDAGRNQAALDLAEVRRNLAVADYEKTVQTAFRDVADALAARHWLIEQLRITRIGLAAQRERARLAKLRYDSGAAPYLEVLDAQRDLLAAEQQLVQVRRALLSARVSLYAALGGGSAEFAAQDQP